MDHDESRILDTYKTHTNYYMNLLKVWNKYLFRIERVESIEKNTYVGNMWENGWRWPLYFTDLLLLAARRSDLLGATLSLRPPSASLTECNGAPVPWPGLFCTMGGSCRGVGVKIY
jgi:hypothetical protein